MAYLRSNNQALLSPTFYYVETYSKVWIKSIQSDQSRLNPCLYRILKLKRHDWSSWILVYQIKDISYVYTQKIIRKSIIYMIIVSYSDKDNDEISKPCCQTYASWNSNLTKINIFLLRTKSWPGNIIHRQSYQIFSL